MEHNIIIDRSIPSFIRENHELFVAFFKAYYEWLELNNYTANNIQNFRDSDSTLETFIDNFTNEYLVGIPKEVLADKFLLSKNIKQLYLNKGNKNSFKFLFQILYGEDIEVYYPRVDVLRASDGKWYQQRSVKVLYSTGDDYLNWINKSVVGQSSGKTAIIENVIRLTERGEDILEISLSQVRGTFVDSEEIRILYLSSGVQQYYSKNIAEIYTGINIVDQGSGYQQGDSIIIRDSLLNEIGKARVTKVSKGSVLNINIDAPGTGYKGQYYLTTIFLNLPLTHIFSGTLLENTVCTPFLSLAANHTVSQQSVNDLPDDPIIISDSFNGSGYGAYARIVEVDYDNNREVVSVEVINKGNNYESPSAIIESDTGTGAILSIVGGGGAISNIKLDDFPIVTSDLPVTADFSLSGDGNATGTILTGGFAEYPGRWLNEDGHLSSTKRLQDNFYYQDYSYVIRIGRAFSEWSSILQDTIHPAGLKFFGETKFSKVLNKPIQHYSHEVITA